MLQEKKKTANEASLYRRLFIFFIITLISVIFIFTLLLFLFGVLGNESKSVSNHIDTELSVVEETINDNFSSLSLDGIAMSTILSNISEEYFTKNNISADQLYDHSEFIEPLLREYMQTLINIVSNRHCGGTFVMLNCSMSGNSASHKSGVFLKKTQPKATNAMDVQLHYLRGPAVIARENNIMLLAQWNMEFDISGQDFFDEVIETAKNNPSLPLSRLYFWSDRVLLKGNSETGFLLCIPLRMADGTILGVCGIEVSDRMFKELYTPKGSNFENIFTLMAPSSETNIYSSRGLLAGNSYLTGGYFDSDFNLDTSESEILRYRTDNNLYAGKTSSLHLYAQDSPYANQLWTVSVLMPQESYYASIQEYNSNFVIIILVLLLISLPASITISKYYLKPIKIAFERIKSNTYASGAHTEYYAEIHDLFDYLAKKDQDHEKMLQQNHQETEALKVKHEEAQSVINQLAYSRQKEIDPECYRMFLDNLGTLTRTERIVFDHYLSGKSAKEILEIMGIKESTLKYHNRNIYSKLGLSSRKELLRYAALMKHEQETSS